MSKFLLRDQSSTVVVKIIGFSSWLLGLAALALILLIIPKTRRLVLAILPLPIRRHADHFIDGAAGSLRCNWFKLILATAGLWAMECVRLYLVTIAIGATMSIPQVIFIVMAATLLASIPFSFSGLGFVEGGITSLLLIFHLNEALGLATIICDRIISFASVVVLGFLSFLFVKSAS